MIETAEGELGIAFADSPPPAWLTTFHARASAQTLAYELRLRGER